jgi:hypothetical protein
LPKRPPREFIDIYGPVISSVTPSAGQKRE